MDKKFLIIGGIVLVLILGVAGFFAFQSFNAKPSDALLSIRTGSVEVSSGSNWISATDGMKLAANQKVRTGADGEALITFFETATVELSPNTEISVAEASKKKVALKLEEGSIWNKVLKLGGLNEYEVSTPNSVATVRGTEFGSDYNKSSEESWVTVGEGEVEFNDFKEKKMVSKGKIFKTIKGKMTELQMDEKVKQKVKKKMSNTLQNMKEMRVKLIGSTKSKYSAIVDMMKQRYNVDEEQMELAIAHGLVEADNGTLNEDELLKQVPIEIEELKRLKELNQAIRDQIKNVKEVE